MTAAIQSISDFLGNPWFVRTYRLIGIAGAAMLGWIGYQLTTIDARTTKVEAAQVSGARDDERFESEVRTITTNITRDVDDLGDGVDDLQSRMISVQTGVARIEGVLTLMQRHDTATGTEAR